jgi:hypothetical protein
VNKIALALWLVVPISSVVTAVVLIVLPQEVMAWSAYSSQTGLRCEQCHTRSGNLTEFGKKIQSERQ